MEVFSAWSRELGFLRHAIRGFLGTRAWISSVERWFLFSSPVFISVPQSIDCAASKRWIRVVFVVLFFIIRFLLVLLLHILHSTGAWEKNSGGVDIQGWGVRGGWLRLWLSLYVILLRVCWVDGAEVHRTDDIRNQ